MTWSGHERPPARAIARHTGLICALAAVALPAAGCSDDPEPPQDPALFDTSRLHEISIEVADEHLDTLANQLEDRVPCTFTFDGRTLSGVGIRRKGGLGSMADLEDNPSFSVKLDDFRPGQKLDGVDKLLLNNSLQDPSLLNEHLGYEISRRAGVPAPRTAHAVVRFNGDVYGIYVVKEAIDRQFLRRNFGGHFRGNLYEGCCVDDFASMPWAPELKHEREEHLSRAALEDLARTITDAPDPVFAERLPQLLDVERFLTAWAVEVMTAHWDGFLFNLNNYYMYQNPADGRFLFLPHGMDQLFEDACFDPLQEPMAHLGERLLKVPGFEARLRDEIVRVAGEPWDLEALSKRISDVTTAIHAAAPMDDADFEWDLSSHEASVAAVLETLALRKQIGAGLAAAACGDGRVEGMEHCRCEDGNTRPGDGCNEFCEPEYCGDELVQGAEVCDGTGCNLDCTGPAVCGDGRLDPGEDCDDGNSVADDACDRCRHGCARDSHEGRSYAFCPEPVAAAGARDVCTRLGGALVVPEDAAENEWLMLRAEDAGIEDFWLGLSDAAEEGAWRTDDGAPPASTQWGRGCPNGSTLENCAVMVVWDDGAWNDKRCDEDFAVVCRLP